MKKLRIIFGWVLVLIFILILIAAFIYNIIVAGWYFLISLLILAAISGGFILGVYLISKK